MLRDYSQRVNVNAEWCIMASWWNSRGRVHAS